MEAPKTVLIIDDDPTILETARRLLERDGMQVFVYNQATDATAFALKGSDSGWSETGFGLRRSRDAA